MLFSNHKNKIMLKILWNMLISTNSAPVSIANSSKVFFRACSEQNSEFSACLETPCRQAWNSITLWFWPPQAWKKNTLGAFTKRCFIIICPPQAENFEAFWKRFCIKNTFLSAFWTCFPRKNDPEILKIFRLRRAFYKETFPFCGFLLISTNSAHIFPYFH